MSEEVRRQGATPGSRVRRAEPAGGAFRLLLAANPLPMWVYDLETLRFLEVNDAAVVHYGYSRDAFLAMTIADIRPAEDRARLRALVAERREILQSSGQWRHRRADGALIEVEVTSHLLDWEGRRAALAVVHDVTETNRLHDELARRALFDDATGLANAALFADRTAAALARAEPEGRQVGVLVVGLGALDTVASTAGDEAADAIVAATARCLRASCDPQDTLARLGGGRFAVLREADDDHAIVRLASSLASPLASPVAVPGWGELKGVPSVGVALAGVGLGDAASLVRDAASAMRHAAERGGGSFVVANLELRRAAVEAFETERALERAVARGELCLHYQPVVALESGEVVACEALVRWARPGHGLVGPDRFIPLAERNGLIIELGAFVIDRAIAEAASWPERMGGRPKVGINLSALQLRDERLVERFTAACAAAGLPLSSVCAELTESAFVATDDYGAYRALSALRGLGVEVAIDDFGTGYSALSYLKHLPVDVVKVDRGFVAGLGVDQADALLVDAMVRVAHGPGLKVVAEGIETPSQLDAVRGLGCDAAQGYLLAPPSPSAGLHAGLEQARLAVVRHVPAPGGRGRSATGTWAQDRRSGLG